MKLFVYKSLFIGLLIFIIFHATFGYTVKSYESKLQNTLSKEKINYLKEKIRIEIKKGLEKDKILEKEDAIMIKKFLNKISNEINNVN
jgi:hypothetical protein